MTKLKQSLKKRVKVVLLSLSLLSFSSCSPIKPTYKEEDIPKSVVNISKKEYGVEVKAKKTSNTLWVYIPFSNLLDKNNSLDKDVSEKIRDVLSVIQRVILSSDKATEFYCLVASDIEKLGADYIILGYSLDVKKYYAGYIPWVEMNRRYIVSSGINPYALGDKEAEHIPALDISLPKFLAQQISQRAKSRLIEKKFNKIVSLKDIKGSFSEETFRFELELEMLDEGRDEAELFKEVASVTKEVTDNYDFKDFILVQIENTKTTKRLTFSRSALKGL